MTHSPKMPDRTRVAILGSTGSIGSQALDLIGRFPERFEVVALAAGSRVDLLSEQAARFRPRLAAIARPELRPALEQACAPLGIETAAGEEGMVRAATHDLADRVVSAIVGAAGLKSTLEAIRARKTVALANKETLVMAGELMMREAEHHNARILPVDSEHSALHQCLRGERREEVRRLILTSSGGPFRLASLEQMAAADPEEALRHPTWSMGPKISIDSATLMNKGLEVIEAHWLFGIEAECIEVLLHPQSLVHSMVEMRDGSVICQMGVADMRGPLQYALSFPDRWESPFPSLDLASASPLEFYPPDRRRFPCLDLATAALRTGGTAPAVLNAANEVAVGAYLRRGARLPDIPRTIEKVLEEHVPVAADSLAAILQADEAARRRAEQILAKGVAA